MPCPCLPVYSPTHVNKHTVRYSPKFYKDLLAEPGTTQYTYDKQYIKFAYFNGFAVGAIAARLEPIEEESDKFKMYVCVYTCICVCVCP